MHTRAHLGFALFIALAAGTACAENTTSVSNGMEEAVRVYWTAAGCAKVVDGKTFVCESKVIQPGQTDSHTWKRINSLTKVAVSGPKACEGKKAVDAVAGVTVNPDCSLGEEKPQFTNKRSETVKLFWTATGCAGVDEGVTFVCRSVRLAPGETDSYSFNKLTADRGYTWISAKCPTAVKQRFGFKSYVHLSNSVNDATACK